MRARRHLGRRLVASALLIALGLGRPAAGEEVLVPPELQAALLVKVLSFDRNLRALAGKDLVLGILVQRGNRASRDAAEEVMAAVAGLGEPSAREPRLHAILVEVGSGQLGASLDALHVEVLYVTPLRALSIAEVTAATRARSVRTVTGVPTYVREGVSVGLAVRDDRPEILVNLAAARAEGSDFSSQFLNLARVIE
jgi:hypothetical protein